MLKHAQLQDLSQQFNNGRKVVERLVSVLNVVLEDELCFFETAETRIIAERELEGAIYYLKTGTLIETKGDDSEQD